MRAIKAATLMLVLLVSLASAFPVEPSSSRLKETGRSLPIVISQYSNVGIANRKPNKPIEPKSLDAGEEEHVVNDQQQSPVSREPSQGPKGSLEQQEHSDESTNAAEAEAKAEPEPHQGQQVDELSVDQVREKPAQEEEEKVPVNEPVAPAQEPVPEKVTKSSEQKSDASKSKKDAMKSAEVPATKAVNHAEEDEIDEPVAMKNEKEKKAEKVAKDDMKDPDESDVSQEPKASDVTQEMKANSFAADKNEEAEEAAKVVVETDVVVTKVVKNDEESDNEKQHNKPSKELSNSALQNIASDSDVKSEKVKVLVQLGDNQEKQENEEENPLDNQMLPVLTADELIEEDRSFKSSPEVLNLEAVQQRASTTGLDKKTLADLSQLDIIVDTTRLQEFNVRLDEKKEKDVKEVKDVKEKDKAKLLGKPTKETKPSKLAKLNFSLGSDDPVFEYQEPERK